MTWSDFLIESFVYLMVMGVWCLPALVIGIIVSVVRARKSPGTLKRRIDRLTLFLGVFLGVGLFFNLLWSCVVWGWLYTSADPLVDFVPILPITQRRLDPPWELLGISLFQLQLVWFVFAASTWAVTVGLYRLIVSLSNTLPNPAYPV